MSERSSASPACEAKAQRDPHRVEIKSASERSSASTPCAEADPDLWFAERPADLSIAKALCAHCPIKAACLAGALDRGEPWGVWGGEIVQQGVVLAYKRGRGRPSNADRRLGLVTRVADSEGDRPVPGARRRRRRPVAVVASSGPGEDREPAAGASIGVIGVTRPDRAETLRSRSA